MRINRETLLKIARDTTAQRTRADRGIQAVYLSGALLEEEYLLGRTADIDLTFIHIDAPFQKYKPICFLKGCMIEIMKNC